MKRANTTIHFAKFRRTEEDDPPMGKTADTIARGLQVEHGVALKIEAAVESYSIRNYSSSVAMDVRDALKSDPDGDIDQIK